MIEDREKNKLVLLDFTLNEIEFCHLEIYYCYEDNRFKYNFTRKYPVFSRESKKYYDTAYLRYLKQKDWLSRLDSYFSSVIQKANNDIRMKQCKPTNFFFTGEASIDKETKLKKYKIAYNIADTMEEERLNLAFTDGDIIYHDKELNRHFVKKTESLDEDIKKKISEIISYMERKVENDMYVQNLAKENLIPLGDPKD